MGEIPKVGSTVEIQYVGTLGSSPMNWGVEDVVECWLKNQQGLYDKLSQPFRDNSIDGDFLMNEDVFNEAFVAETLGLENKILCKKTVMAAKRLRKHVEEYSEGTEFDSSVSKGKTFQFVLGKGKVIKAMDLLVSSMRIGEKAKVTCRADYGYGSEGYRKANGEVVVPPFATLCFDVTLLSAT
jgi:FKBP-type peptidyl-prolyl cis-trans isomerases 1